MERVAVGLLGLGTVNGGVARLLHLHADRIAQRAGSRVEIKAALVRGVARARESVVSPNQMTTDPHQVVADPEIRIVIEAMGGTEPAFAYVMESLAQGKDVITANKALLAEHGREIFDQARKFGRVVAFEGSVAGGIPIVASIGESLAANQIQSLAAIVNGTCNFILTAMTGDGMPYDVALAQAQEFGYAESNPTLDVDGTDTAHKLAILAQLAFQANVKCGDIPRRGIDTLQSADTRYAAELGYSVKLLALAKLSEAGLDLRVAPTLVRQGTPLAEVRGPYNAVRVVGDAVGDTLFYGRGAGAMPTASAVVGDLVGVLIGRDSFLFRTRNHWSGGMSATRLVGPDRIRSRYYLRFTIADRPGVIGAIAQSLGEQEISIASVIQHDPGDDHPEATVPLVIMTHSTTQARVAAAIAEIDGLDAVNAPSVCLGVEE